MIEKISYTINIVQIKITISELKICCATKIRKNMWKQLRRTPLEVLIFYEKSRNTLTKFWITKSIRFDLIY